MTDKNDRNTSLILPDVSVYDEAFLLQSIRKRMQILNYQNPEHYQLELEQNVAERILLMKSLQVSYSEFFRNSLTFSVLEKLILPELIQKTILHGSSNLRFWSMACASGQEPYSLAMMMEEYMEKLDRPLAYQLFATDHNEAEIEIASRGFYTDACMSNMSLKRLDRWFVRAKNGYVVKDELRKHIQFSVFDVVSNPLSSPPESIFGSFDLILCANLLFYYNKETQKVILDKAESSLSNQGYLLTGEVERNLLNDRMFKETYPYSAIFKKLT
ncbi:MAG TPA: CheR family methyltransferase [Bacteroidales bacterium]|nr:CheR family methyltransferase [Bacteroidales bacterium]